MFLGAIITAICLANACFHGINYNVPEYVTQQNFGLVDFFYRTLKVVSAPMLFYSLWICDIHWPSIVIGLILYGVAFGVKRLTRHLAYDI